MEVKRIAVIGVGTIGSMRRSMSASKLILGVILFGFLASAAILAQSEKALAAESKGATSRYGGILRISATREAVTLGHPALMERRADMLYIHGCIENLVGFDENGAPIPWLATGWKTDAKAKTITLTLRKGVKFHDGTDFNAKAAKWNLDQYIATKRAELAAVKSVDVIDDFTIRLNLSRMDSLVISTLGMTSGLMISPTAFEKGGKTERERIDWASNNPVGTGPFKFVSWQRSVKQVYQRFDGYWQKGKPYLNGYEVVIIADPTVQQAAFTNGEVDVLVGVDPKTAKDLAVTGKYSVAVGKLPEFMWHLQADSAHSNSVYANQKVRQAVAHAIDNREICSTLGLGYWQPLNQLAPAGNWAYNPDVKGYPYNPARAKQLLAEAGYANGFKTTLFAQNLPANVDVTTAIQGYLSQVGIEAQIDLMEVGRWAKLAIGGGWENGLALQAFTIMPNEFGPQYNRLSRDVHSKYAAPVAVADEILDLIDRAGAAPDLKSMRPLMHQIQKLEIDKHTMLMPLFSNVTINVKHKHVHDDRLDTKYYWTAQDAWIEK